MERTCEQRDIERLFFKQIKELTAKTIAQSYEYQFSDGWIRV